MEFLLSEEEIDKYKKEVVKTFCNLIAKITIDYLINHPEKLQITDEEREFINYRPLPKL